MKVNLFSIVKPNCDECLCILDTTIYTEHNVTMQHIVQPTTADHCSLFQHFWNTSDLVPAMAHPSSSLVTSLTSRPMNNSGCNILIVEPFKYLLYLHIRTDNNTTHSPENLISIKLDSCQPVEDVMKM